VCDAQIGHEKTLTGLIPALAGANMIYGLGMLESGITFDFGQLVLDAEFARMVKHTVKGIPVDDESLAVDVIREVGAFGDFLCHKHTLKRMRSQSQPAFIDRTMRENWEKKGSLDVHQKAMNTVRHILETHKPDPLPNDVLQKIRAIVAETEKEMGISCRSNRNE
jgi:trimethylamine---corrinoid protein Co-methyltransferase